MKELSDVINNIRFGSILCIDHYISSNKNMYNSLNSHAFQIL